MIAEIVGFIIFLILAIGLIWRISVKNRTLYESPVFRTFTPIFLLAITAGYIIIVILRWNPTISITGITALALLAGGGAYLQMPFGSKHFLAHLKICSYDIAPKGSWMEITQGQNKIIGQVVALKTTAVTLKDVEGALHTIENADFLSMRPRRLEITQVEGEIQNIYHYRVDACLPFRENIQYMEIKQLIRNAIIEKQMSIYQGEEQTTQEGEAIASTMTGFVFGNSGVHVSPRVYFTLEAAFNGAPYAHFVVLVPCKDYLEGWSKWHSYVGKIVINMFNMKVRGG